MTKNVKLPLKTRIKNEWNRNMIVYVFMIPILIHFLIFQAYPLVFSFALTFMDWQPIGSSTFAGLDNWIRFFHDGLAWRSLWNTLLFSLYYIVPTMGLGLIFALFINSGLRLTGVFKVVFFLPVVTSFVIVAGIWQWLFQGDANGMVNYLLGLVGIDPQLFLSSSVQALMVLAALSVFKVSGQMMIYYFAGLKSIPPQLYEAARIDGASSWKAFWSITMPLLKPFHFYVAILATINSFQIFDSTYLLTNGGPDNSTSTIVYYLYRQGFESIDLSYASTLAYALFAVILTITLIQRKYLGGDTVNY